MGASFWVYAQGLWRRLEVSSGRVGGWAGRARFCYVRRGRVHQARAAAVLRGLRALQAEQPTSVRDGLPLSQRRRVRAASPRCCCRRAAADARNALVQLNLTALQTSTAPQRNDAAVQADGPTHDGEQPGRARGRSPGRSPGRAPGRSPGPPRPAPAPPGRPAARSDSEQSAPACKELIVNEEDVSALRRFLARDRSGAALLAADPRRFDADDRYKSALFYRINPLVCAERDARIPAMLARERDEQRLLRAFAGELGLRAVGGRGGGGGQHAAEAGRHKSPNKSRNTSHNKSRNSSRNKSCNGSRNSRKLVDSDSAGSSDDSDFQTHCSVTNKKSYERNTRSKFSEIRSKYEKSKSQRDDDARSKYLVTPRQVRVDSGGSASDDRSKRSRTNNSDDYRSKDREIPAKDKERNEIIHLHHKRKKTQRNLSKNRNDMSKENGQSTSNLRVRDESVSPSIITGRSKARSAKDSSGKSDSADLQVRNSILRDRRGRFEKAPARTDRLKKQDESNNNDNSKDRKRNWSPSKGDTAKDKKNDTRLNHIHVSKDKHTDSESSQNHSSKSKIAFKDQSKTVNGRSPKSAIKRKINELEDSGDDASDNAWAAGGGAGGVRGGAAQGKEGADSNGGGGKDGVERGGSKRPRRSTANASSVYPEKRREYSSLEDHAIVQWVSLGARARRVNGNAVWRELQEQFARIAGRSRSWHSLRNRYLRSILPALGTLALPPARVAALRAAHAQGEIKSRRRAPLPNPLLALPPVRSAWGARAQGGRGGRAHHAMDTLEHATSESEPSQRTLRPSTARADSPRRRTPRTLRTAPPPSSNRPQSPRKTNASSRQDQPSPTYSDVTRRFGARQAASTPELRRDTAPRDTAPRDTAPRDTAPRDTAPRDASPHKRTRKLFNPKTAM